MHKLFIFPLIFLHFFLV